MQFFNVVDQSEIKHKVLIVPLSQTEMNRVGGQCQQCLPSISVSSMLQTGHPYLIIDLGADTWKTAIPLDKTLEDGHRVGDELSIGDVLNIVLTSEPNAIKSMGEKAYLNVPVESLIAFSVLISAEIAEIYQLHRLLTQPKAA